MSNTVLASFRASWGESNGAAWEKSFFASLARRCRILLFYDKVLSGDEVGLVHGMFPGASFEGIGDDGSRALIGIGVFILHLAVVVLSALALEYPSEMVWGADIVEKQQRPAHSRLCWLPSIMWL